MPNQEYDSRNSLVFFENTKKRADKNDPDFTGTYTDGNGQEHWLSIWPKTNRKDGSTFWTGSTRPKEARPASGRPFENAPRPGPARAGSLSMRRRPDPDEVP